MKKRGLIVLLLITSINLVSAQIGLGEFLDAFGGENLLLIGSFIISFALINFILGRLPMFKDKYTGKKNKTIPGIIAFILALFIIYGINTLNFNISNFFFNLGLTAELLELIIVLVILGGLIFLFWKFKSKVLLFLGILLLIIVLFTDWIYEKDIVFFMGLGLIALYFIIRFISRKKPREAYTPSSPDYGYPSDRYDRDRRRQIERERYERDRRRRRELEEIHRERDYKRRLEEQQRKWKQQKREWERKKDRREWERKGKREAEKRETRERTEAKWREKEAWKAQEAERARAKKEQRQGEYQRAREEQQRKWKEEKGRERRERIQKKWDERKRRRAEEQQRARDEQRQRTKEAERARENLRQFRNKVIFRYKIHPDYYQNDKELRDLANEYSKRIMNGKNPEEIERLAREFSQRKEAILNSRGRGKTKEEQTREMKALEAGRRAGGQTREMKALEAGRKIEEERQKEGRLNEEYKRFKKGVDDTIKLINRHDDWAYIAGSYNSLLSMHARFFRKTRLEKYSDKAMNKLREAMENYKRLEEKGRYNNEDFERKIREQNEKVNYFERLQAELREKRDPKFQSAYAEWKKALEELYILQKKLSERKRR